MIDIESKVFTTVYNAVHAAYPSAFITGEARSTRPASFPAVYINQFDSYVSRYDSSRQEKFNNIAFEVFVYSNAVSGRKTQCKSIMSVVDDSMRGMGFIRTQSEPLSFADSDNTEITAYVNQYAAEVDVDGTIYARR